MTFATDQTVPLHRLAPEVESRGFESLWVTEKTHVPISRETPWPGGDLPEWYKRTCDPFVALAAAAATTTTLRLGTGTALVALRDPIIAAKEIASLDWISGGRVELGVGYGWNVEEHRSHGIALDDAPDRLADHLALMRTVWGRDDAGYRGSHYTLVPSWSWPKPVQADGPRVHLGSRASPRAFADIAAWGHGWLPIEGYGTVVNHLPSLRAAFERAGRGAEDPIVSVYSSSGDPARLDQYREAGIDRVVLAIAPADPTTVMHALDAAAARGGVVAAATSRTV